MNVPVGWRTYLSKRKIKSCFVCCNDDIDEATQGQRTKEPTTQVTLKRRGEDRTQAMSKNPKRAQIGSL